MHYSDVVYTYHVISETVNLNDKTRYAGVTFDIKIHIHVTGLILGLHPANERRRYNVTPSLIGWAQT